jgi:predicted ATPase
MNWLLGYPDRAAESCKSARALANALDNPSSQVLSLLFSTWIHQYRREPEVVLQYANAAIAICDCQNILPNPRAAASIMKLWAQSVLDPSLDLIRAMHDSIKTWETTGRDLGRISHYQSILAELYAKAGRIEEGLAVIEDAFENAVGAGRLRLDAALFGEKGKLLLARSEPNTEEAEQCIENSLQLSRQIEAHSLELRAATTLANHWHRQGKTADARALLEPVYNWFTEGFDTEDLIDAKALLAILE